MKTILIQCGILFNSSLFISFPSLFCLIWETQDGNNVNTSLCNSKEPHMVINFVHFLSRMCANTFLCKLIILLYWSYINLKKIVLVWFHNFQNISIGFIKQINYCNLLFKGKHNKVNDMLFMSCIILVCHQHIIS